MLYCIINWSDLFFNSFKKKLLKSAFIIFDSEGTLNEGRVSGQDGSLGNTLN